MIIIYNLATQFSTMKFLQACITKIFITILAKPESSNWTFIIGANLSFRRFYL